MAKAQARGADGARVGGRGAPAVPRARAFAIARRRRGAGAGEAPPSLAAGAAQSKVPETRPTSMKARAVRVSESATMSASLASGSKPAKP